MKRADVLSDSSIAFLTNHFFENDALLRATNIGSCKSLDITFFVFFPCIKNCTTSECREMLYFYTIRSLFFLMLMIFTSLISMLNFLKWKWIYGKSLTGNENCLPINENVVLSLTAALLVVKADGFGVHNVSIKQRCLSWRLSDTNMTGAFYEQYRQ